MDKSFASWQEVVSNQCWTSCLFARWLSELRKLEGYCKLLPKVVQMQICDCPEGVAGVSVSSCLLSEGGPTTTPDFPAQ